MTVRVAKLSGRLSRAYAVGRAGLSLTTQRLKPKDMFKAEPMGDEGIDVEKFRSLAMLVAIPTR